MASIKKGKMNRTVNFKFGNTLPVGIEVTIRQTNENTYMVMTDKEPTVEYLVMKDAVTLNSTAKKIRGYEKKIGL